MTKWCKCGHMKTEHKVDGCLHYISPSYFKRTYSGHRECFCKTFRLSHECSLGSL